MAEAASEHPKILGNKPQCGEDTNLLSDYCLLPDSNHSQEIEPQMFDLRNAASTQYVDD